MLEIIMIIAGIVACSKRSYYLGLRADDYPDIEPGLFRQWHEAKKSSVNLVLYYPWIQMANAALCFGVLGNREDSRVIGIAVYLLVFLVMLVSWGVMNGRVEKAKKQILEASKVSFLFT